MKELDALGRARKALAQGTPRAELPEDELKAIREFQADQQEKGRRARGVQPFQSPTCPDAYYRHFKTEGMAYQEIKDAGCGCYEQHLKERREAYAKKKAAK